MGPIAQKILKIRNTFYTKYKPEISPGPRKTTFCLNRHLYVLFELIMLEIQEDSIKGFTLSVWLHIGLGEPFKDFEVVGLIKPHIFKTQGSKEITRRCVHTKLDPGKYTYVTQH